MNATIETRRVHALATAAVAAVLVMGLAGAFVGLDSSSYSDDELFTKWVVGSDGSLSGLFQRISADVHPPLYYLTAFLVSGISGHSDVALRAFSAVCAGAAVVILVIGTRRSFSLPARLVAGAVAVCSRFWFFQAQNARSYGLAMLGVAVLIVLVLEIEHRLRRAPAKVPRLAGVCVALAVVTSFVHFYAMFTVLALCLTTALLVRASARTALATGAVILALAQLYLSGVIRRYSEYSTTYNWIKGDAHWFAAEAKYAVTHSFGAAGMLVLGVCGLVFIARHVARRPAMDAPLPGRLWQVLSGLRDGHAVVGLAFLAPLIVFAGAVASSILVAPNFTGQNALVCSPMIWLAVAWIYDQGVGRLSGGGQTAALVAIALPLVWGSAILTNRMVPGNEPWRELGAYAQRLGDCRGRPVVLLINEDPGWAHPAFIAQLDRFRLAHYDRQDLRSAPIFVSDLLAGRLSPEVAASLAGAGSDPNCPIVAEWADNFDRDRLAGVETALAAHLGEPARTRRLLRHEIDTHKPSLTARPTLGRTGVIFYLAKR